MPVLKFEKRSDPAETPAPIPTWVWVLLLLIVAWSIFYTARQWSPSGSFAQTPTYSAWPLPSGSGGAQGAVPHAR